MRKGFYCNIKFLDKVIKKNRIGRDEKQRLLTLLEKPYYFSYFFRNLYDKSWFCFFGKKYFILKLSSKKYTYQAMLDYLTQLRKEDKKVIDGLINLMKEVSLRSRKKEVATWYAFIRIISDLPQKCITKKFLSEILPIWLSSKHLTVIIALTDELLPRLLTQPNKNKDLIETILLSLLEIKYVYEKQLISGERKREAVFKISEPYYLRKFINQNIDIISKICRIEFVEEIAKRLNQCLRMYTDNMLSNGLIQDYSYIWYENLEVEPELEEDKPKVMLTSILKRIIIDKPIKEVIFLIESFLAPKYPYLIFKRLVIYFLTKRYKESPQLCLSLIRNFFENYFDEKYLSEEAFEFCKKYFESLSSDLKDKIAEKISEKFSIIETTDPLLYESELLELSNWYSVIGKYSPGFKFIYLRYKNEIEKVKAKYEPYKAYDEQRRKEDLSREKELKEEILKVNTKERVDILLKNRSDIKIRFIPDKDLSDILVELIEEYPSKFIEDISYILQHSLIFKSLDLGYKLSYIRGFTKVWSQRKEERGKINIRKILELCWEIVKDKIFWKNFPKNDKREKINLDRAVWIIARFIYEGVKTKESSFPADCFNLVERILLAILKNYHKGKVKVVDKFKKKKDLLTEVINNPIGVAFEALLRYCLIYARVNEERLKDKPKWPSKKVKGILNLVVEKKLRGLEFPTLLGLFFPNLYYLDKKWTEANIDKIFTFKNKDWWNAVMEGYLWNHTWFAVIYKLLRNHGVYKLALREFKGTDSAKKSLIEHICIGYLKGIECLKGKDSLFWLVLKRWRGNEIQHVISYFWKLRDEEMEEKTRKEIQDKIIEFWKYCYKKYEEKIKRKNLSNEDEKILSDLNLLAVFLPDLKNDYKKLLLQSSPFAEKHFQTSFLLKELKRLVDNNPREVGEIYIRLLRRKDSLPVYYKEEIKYIIETIYKKAKDLNDKKLKRIADKICIVYGKKVYAISGRLEFVRKLYEEYNFMS